MPNVDQEEVAQFHRLVREHEMLLAVCEKHDELHKHEMGCWDCPYHCKVGNRLRREAKQLRQAALAAVQGE